MDKVRIYKTISGRIRSSSILEVTVALVIISITFGIFMMIYVNLLSGNYYLQKLKYEGKLTIQYQELVQSKNFIDEVKEDETVRIFQTILPYRNATNIKLVELKAINRNGKVLAEHKTLYYVNP
jgi:hypothetical protein